MENQNKCRATGKVRFPDPGTAKEAIIRIKTTDRFYDHIQGKRVNRRAGKPGQCRFYYCKDCHGWHLTSQEQTKSFRKYKKERKLGTKDLLLNEKEAAEWKKNSIPFPEPKKQVMNLELISARDMAIKYPSTFNAPCNDCLNDIHEGDYVKICPGEERFWCNVIKVDKDNRSITASVSNRLIHYDLPVGTVLEIDFDNVYDILKPEDINL